MALHNFGVHEIPAEIALKLLPSETAHHFAFIDSKAGMLQWVHSEAVDFGY
jgi:hypothetical protein